jgi:hypothetical protein
MKASNTTTRTTDELLDRISMTDSERLVAHAALAQGERIADVVLAVFSLFRTAVLGAERELRGITRSKSYN